MSFRPGLLYAAAPVALVASFMIGVSNGAFWGLGALSVSGRGLSVNEVAWFMSFAVMAGALAQWPLGRLSDRIDRRIVLVGALAGSTVAGIALWLVPPTGSALLALGFLFGAMALPTYSLAAAHGYDKTPASDTVVTAATILLANGLGSAIGPFFASALMAWLGPGALFLFTAIAQALLAVYVIHRIRVMATLTPPDKTDFDLATTAPVGTVVAVDPADVPPPDDGRSLVVVPAERN